MLLSSLNWHGCHSKYEKEGKYEKKIKNTAFNNYCPRRKSFWKELRLSWLKQNFEFQSSLSSLLSSFFLSLPQSLSPLSHSLICSLFSLSLFSLFLSHLVFVLSFFVFLHFLSSAKIFVQDIKILMSFISQLMLEFWNWIPQKQKQTFLKQILSKLLLAFWYKKSII